MPRRSEVDPRVGEWDHDVGTIRDADALHAIVGDFADAVVAGEFERRASLGLALAAVDERRRPAAPLKVVAVDGVRVDRIADVCPRRVVDDAADGDGAAFDAHADAEDQVAAGDDDVALDLGLDARRAADDDEGGIE